MAIDLADYECGEHGGLVHAIVHVSGIAVCSWGTAISFDSVSVPSLDEWATAVEAGSLGGLTFAEDSLWLRMRTTVHAKLGLGLVLAGSVNELVQLGHALPHVQGMDLKTWYRSIGHTDHLDIASIEGLTGIALKDALANVHDFITSRRHMYEAVAGALSAAPGHTMTSGEIAAVAVSHMPSKNEVHPNIS